MKTSLTLWEILVPAADNAGKEFTIDFHRQWDAKVRIIAGGMTIMKAARGQWTSPETFTVYSEKMLPVRIACMQNEMAIIAAMTKEHYAQEKVMYYKIASEVYFL